MTVKGDGLRGEIQPLPRRAFLCSPEQLARRLIGCLLVGDSGRSILRIVETEAYHQDEPACHAHRGRTAANASLFGPPGHAYVYFTYGMHYCCNASCGRNDVAAGALLRAAQLIRGAELVRPRRTAARLDRDLARGPARLAACLGIDRRDDGLDLTSAESRFYLASDGTAYTSDAIQSGPRVGVRLAADLPWRYWLRDCEYVSPYRRHPKADPA